QAEDKRARAIFKRLADDKAGHHTGAARYWQARTAERMGDSEEARRIYHEIVNGEEDSYYRGPAAKRLEGMGAAVKENKISRPPPSSEAIPPPGSPISFHLARARELTEMELHRLAISELDEIKDQSSGELPLQALLMREYARNRAYDRSVSLANELGPSREEWRRFRYPLAYWEMIQKGAEQQDVDPFLIVALIRQESLFDPRALSPASAHGLMQLLPSTAARIARQLGIPPPQPETLFDPELNLTLGIHYLKELLKLYSNSVVKALAAYNAGENAVARWEKQIRTEDEEEFIERIPYGETRLYVKLVLRNHLNYRNIYASER
ncbi:MAG: transglycosylase SLT domain-containing protein, partial [Candidatus Binatia bacterium]